MVLNRPKRKGMIYVQILEGLGTASEGLEKNGMAPP